MKKLFQKFVFAGFTCLAFSMAYAQEPAPKGDKLGEYDEIIIKRNNNKDGKVTVEIKDGNVLVDGEKLESYKDGDISVYRRKIRPMDGNNFNFQPHSGGLQFFNEAPDNIRPGRALLGVLTEKKEAAGATVKEVSKESPAAKAGLKAGDVITKIDADKIEEPKDLFEKIGAHEPGDKVTVTYLRDKKENTATVTLDERKQPEFGFNRGRDNNDGPENFFRMMPPDGGGRFDFREDDGDDDRRAPRSFSWEDRRENDVKLGLSVQDTEDGNGAVVLAVAPGSAAEKAGFKPKDIITSLAGTSISSTRDVTNAYRENKNKGTVDVQVKRDGKSQTLQVKVPKRLHKADL
ncbi:PDZ domain-containing protein [Chitinophaga sp.]|uniref:PDZ domain-containing protein n=1 Tax=Chitinophaga sp. TaxID=1869181 RepID=UPI0031D3FD03